MQTDNTTWVDAVLRAPYSILTMTRGIIQHIAKLSAELEEHLYRYHILADPNISDKEFDRLLAEL